jgi:hypothetical protein
MDEWNPIDSAPFDRELEVAVIEGVEAHSAAFPCKRTGRVEWMNALDGKIVSIHPTHWRRWEKGSAAHSLT